MLVGPSKCLKQIIQIELNRVENPNWSEANQDYREQIQQVASAGLELGTSELKVQRSNRSSTLPPSDGAKLCRVYL